MTRTDPRRLAAVVAVAAAVVAANPAAVAAQEPQTAQEPQAAPGLTVGGRPLAELLRTEPGAPFVAFESSTVRPVRQGVGENGGRQKTKRLRNALIGAGVGAGVGMLAGVSHCNNESGRNCLVRGLGTPLGAYGTLAGAGIGAAIGALMSR